MLSPTMTLGVFEVFNLCFIISNCTLAINNYRVGDVLVITGD